MSVMHDKDEPVSSRLTEPYEAYRFLVNHPGAKGDERVIPASGFMDGLDIHYVKVNPETNRIDDNDKLNTWTEVWLETGPLEWYQTDEDEGILYTHDPRLDVGGSTFDIALINLANKVLEVYGDY